MKIKGNQVILFAWLTIASIPIGYFMGYHLTSIEQTEIKNPRSLASVQNKKWKMIHIIGESCKCSITLSEYLIKRRPLLADGQLLEEVIIVGSNPQLQKNLEQVGYLVRSEEEQKMVELYNIDAVPQLVLLNADNNLKYSGGYTQERITASTQNSDYQDIEIFQKIKNGEVKNQIPIFGCANGIKNKLKADPIGLKY